MKRINHKMFFGILVTALVLVAMMVPAKAALWDSTTVYQATTVTKYDVAVGSKLKGALDDTVRVVTTHSASPYYILISTDRSTALPMSWVTETVTNTVAMRGCAIGDVDGDGQNEIIIGQTSSPYGLKMVKWNGSAWVLTTVMTSTSSYVGAVYDICIGDADNNSGTVNDIIFNNGSYGVMKARWNGATFDTTRLMYNTSSSYFYGVAIGDFDAAHAGNEIVTVTYNQYVFEIAWTGAAWTSTQIYYIATDLDFYDVAVGDFDASNPGDEIAINNGYNYTTYGAVLELYGSGATWTQRPIYTASTWGSSGEIAVGDFYSGNPGAEVVAVSGSGSEYDARLIYGSGTTWYNEKIMGTGSSTYGVAIGNVNRYRTGNELAVGGNYKVWEAQEHIMANNMQTLSIDNPSGFVQGNSSIPVTATVKNTATNTQNKVPVYLTITDGVSYTYADVESTGTLVQGQSQQIIFSPNWTVPNSFATYAIKVKTVLAGDEYPGDDSVLISIPGIPQGYTMEGFEGTFPPSNWTLQAKGTYTAPWSKSSSYVHSGTYSAMATYNTSGLTNDWLVTPRLDLSAKSGGVLQLWRRFYNGSATYPDTLEILMSTDGGATWPTRVAISTPDSTSDANFVFRSYNLVSSSSNVKIAFRYATKDGYSSYIDDVILPPIFAITRDMAAISVDSVPAVIGTGSSVTVRATVKNFATVNANAPIPVKFSITGPGGYSYTDVDQATSTNLAPLGTEQIIFSPNWTVPSTLGTYTIKAWTELALDQNPINDTVTYLVTVIRTGGMNESFTGTTFPPAGWTSYNFDGGDPWIRYTSFYHSAPACAEIYYDLPNNDWLITPRLKVVSGDQLSFWWRTYSTSYTESLFVRASTSPTVSDTESYSVVDFVTSTGNISWFQKTVDLSGYAGQNIYIAFFYRANNTYGMAIDDVTGPYVPPYIKITPDSVYAEGYVDSFFDVFLNIKNTGLGTLNFSTALSHPASYLNVIPTSGSLGSGVSINDTLRFNTTGLAGHYYDTLLVTSNSGEKSVINAVPIHLYVRMVPNIAISPDSFKVGVEANGTKDTSMFINNTGNGELNYTVETFESSKFGAVFNSEPATGVHDIDLVNNEAKPDKDWIDNRRGVPPTKGQGGPDAFGYKWKDSDAPGGPTFSWVEINAVGTLVTSSDDNNSGPYPIGFPFKFYGNTFTDFRICSNGFISFTSTVNNLTNDTIPSPPEPNNLLALYWDDLYPYSSGTGKIYYYNDGNKLIIEYDHVIRYGQTTCPYTMEAILYPNGKIVYQYLQMGDGTCTYLNQATVGIENATGTVGLEVVFNANYIHNNMAIAFSAAPGWLVFSPETGVAPAFGADTVDITFDATGILGGNFYGGFVVHSDDPDTPVDTIPAHMEVLAPNMTFSPDSIMTTATEGQAPFNVTVDIGNSGNGKLIYSITEGMPWLAVAPVSDTVLVGDPASTVTLTINAGSLYAGHYHGELKVYSNDPNKQPYARYQVYLSVGPYPDITVSPDSFYIGIYAGYTKDTTLKIGNTGDGHLAWGIAIQELGRKGPDTTLYEGFEGTTFPPTGWTVINNDGGTMTWEQTTLYYHTGTKSADCRWESTTLWNDDWLITPKISVGSNDSLSFWQRVYTASNPESLEVRLSTTTTDPSAFTHLLWAGSQLTNTDWQERKIELAKFAKGQVYIAFVYKGLYQWRLYIDDVTVRSFAGPWLTVDPVSGTTNPHTTTNVGVHFSTVGIENDMYANLWITSNDPDESPILVPVHMAILGPNYSVSPPETLVIDALEGAYTDGHIFMQNFGGHAPLAYKLTDPVAWLSENPDTAEVPIDGTRDVTVTVDGNVLIAGDYATKIFIKTNDFTTPQDTLVVIVHMGPPPDISVAPESLRVVVPGGSTTDRTLTISNNGDGHLAFDITTEETGPKAVSGLSDRYSKILQSHASTANIPSDQNVTAQLSGSGFQGDKVMTAPGAPLKAGGDTVYVQWPHDPTDTWSFGTSDAGAGYKMYDNFWGVTLPIKTVEWWGLCLMYNGSAWVAGNPDNLRFNILFYSDPASDPTMPPNQLACSFTNVAPSVVHTGIMYTTSAGAFEMIKFTGLDVNPLCNLPEGWVSIQSLSAGTGGDWFLWASAKTGDGFSYQEGSTTPSTTYDRGFLMLGGAAWLSVSPEADTVNPHTSTDVNVHFDATNILGGDKYGNIIIASNDPDGSPLTVRAHMIIAGANYSIHPLELHINALEGQVTPASLVVSNPGGLGDLSFKMTWTAPWVTANPDSDVVPPDGSKSVTVRIDGYQLIAGDYYTEIMVTTNAANQQLDTIPVYVHVGPDPDVDMSASSLNVGLNPGCEKDVALRVNNLGGGHLSFSTEIEGAKAEFVSVITKKDQQLNQVFGRNKQSKAMLPQAGTQIGKNGDVAPQSAPASSGAGLGNNHYTKGDVLLSEGFEGAWLPTGWTMIQNNFNHNSSYPQYACYWNQMSDYSHGGIYSAGLWWDYYYQDEWLISPSFTAGAACTLSFWTYGYHGSTHGDHYYVMITTDNGGHWNSVFDLSAYTDTGWNYYDYPYYVDISAYTGQSVKLAWYAQDATTDDGIWYAWLVDDILVTSVGPPPPTCPFTVAPEADTLAPTSFEDLVLSFDPGMFEDCSEDTITCNLIITTNDPDEQTLTIPVSSWLSRGDVFIPNCVVDIGDVVFLVNYILKGGPAPSPICVGDVAPPYDGTVDMLDLIYLTQYLFNSGPPPLATPAVTPTPMQR